VERFGLDASDQDRVHRRLILMTVMNLRVPQKARNFLAT
jgi:hypothetical protein